jgi:hypothetical protein
MITPIPNTSANPLIKDTSENQYNITAAIILVILPSRIEVHARPNPCSIASLKSCPH